MYVIARVSWDYHRGTKADFRHRENPVCFMRREQGSLSRSWCPHGPLRSFWWERDLVPESVEHLSTINMFAVAMSSEVGDGSNILFWTDRWLQGQCIADLAPRLIAAVDQKEDSNGVQSKKRSPIVLGLLTFKEL